jgi:hypothetical protein
MTEQQRSQAQIDRYLSRIRRGLRGLSRADVNDTLAELRAHLVDEAAEHGVPTAITRFGDAAEVASAIVARRVAPEGGPAARPPSPGRRAASWAVDAVIGFGPLVLVPPLVSIAVGNWQYTTGELPIWIVLAENLAILAQGNRLPTAELPAWQWIMLTALLVWAIAYWVIARREYSSSLGMWMTGLRGVRVDDERIVVRERDVAQAPQPLGAGRWRWSALALVVPLGLVCLVLTYSFVWSGAFRFLAPRAVLAENPPAAAEVRALEVCALFEEALEAGDLEAAGRLCDPSLQWALDEIGRRMAEPGFRGFEPAPGTSPAGVWLLDDRDAKVEGSWDLIQLIVDVSTQVSGSTYTDTYVIRSIAFESSSNSAFMQPGPVAADSATLGEGPSRLGRTP